MIKQENKVSFISESSATDEEEAWFNSQIEISKSDRSLVLSTSHVSEKNRKSNRKSNRPKSGSNVDYF